MNSGIAIALAWPDTYCKQAGSWYDSFMRLLGFNKNYFYKAGHAAIILVHIETGECHYFDFGRYHSPYQTGRVRSKWTDPELIIQTKAKFIGRQIRNVEEILQEVAFRKACHGQGDLLASMVSIDFERAFSRAIRMQTSSPIKYGPFILNGTNCSCFVRTVLLAGKLSILNHLRLLFPYTLTPSPLTNVQALGFTYRLKVKGQWSIPDPPNIKGLINPPLKPKNIPADAQWLSGEGAGSWVFIEPFGQHYKISRFDTEGILEFKGIYDVIGKPDFDYLRNYEIIHLSHYTRIRVLQSDIEYYFHRISTEIPVNFISDLPFMATGL